MLTLCAVAAGFLLDLLFGDPHWMPHPVRWFGAAIVRLEPFLRRIFPDTARGKRTAGAVLAVLLPLLAFLLSLAVLIVCHLVSPWLRFAGETFWCYQVLATKALRVESTKVQRELERGDLPAARRAVSMIVGRDTECLTEEGVAKAAVETVAENSSDGVIAPLFYLAIGGAPLGLCYKAVNTLDSMAGYKNDKYLDFGRASAKLDDVWNFLPARLAALCTVLASFFCGFDGKNGWRIFRRDRGKSASPNSAQTESVYAGALGLQLLGDAVYFGKVVHKDSIGDPLRPIAPSDIKRANRLLYASAFCFLVLSLAVRAAVWLSLFPGLL